MLVSYWLMAHLFLTSAPQVLHCHKILLQFKTTLVVKHGPTVFAKSVLMDFILIISKFAVKSILIAVNSIQKLKSVKTATKVMLSSMVNAVKVNQIRQIQDVESLVLTIPAHNAQKDGIWAMMGNAKESTTTAELGMIKASA